MDLKKVRIAEGKEPARNTVMYKREIKTNIAERNFARKTGKI